MPPHPGLHTPYRYRPICATAPSPTLVSTACPSLRFLSVVQRHAALLPPVLSILFYFIRVLSLLLRFLHRQRGGYRWGHSERMPDALCTRKLVSCTAYKKVRGVVLCYWNPPALLTQCRCWSPSSFFFLSSFFPFFFSTFLFCTVQELKMKYCSMVCQYEGSSGNIRAYRVQFGSSIRMPNNNRH